MAKIKELIIKYKKIILYLIFGGCTTLVNIITYYICDKIGIGTFLSTIIAWVLSVLFAYATNKKYVFESNVKNIKGLSKEILSFFSCRLATGILDLGIMLLFVDYIHFNGLLIKIISNIAVIILNYVFAKLLIFKSANSIKHK